MANHSFQIRAAFGGGVDGRGRLSAAQLETEFSAAKELGGLGIGTNPDELLVAAVSSCYLITLSAIAARRGVPIERVELESEGTVSTHQGLRFDRIVHRPSIVLAPEATSEQKEAALEIAQRAEGACMISAALRGNVEVVVEARVR